MTDWDDRLIVALDMPRRREAEDMIAALGDAVGFYKIGLELLFGGGLDLATSLKAQGKRVFLDLKFHDIGHTVSRAVENAARLGVDFLTIHGQDDKTLKAAVAGRGNSGVKVLAVTVLTNLDAKDLAADAGQADVSRLVLSRTGRAHAAGCDGVVASGQEAAAIRATTDSRFLIVTPGIRLAQSAAEDQARVVTPRAAMVAGANHIVVGRPITQAPDPRRAAQAVIADMALVRLQER